MSIIGAFVIFHTYVGKNGGMEEFINMNMNYAMFLHFVLLFGILCRVCSFCGMEEFIHMNYVISYHTVIWLLG